MAPPPAGGAAALLQTPLLSLADAPPLGLPYEDGFVRLTASDVTLKRYYFPTFQGKTIKLQSIQEARLLPMPSIFKEGYKQWGMALDCRRWWPSDMLRHRRKSFIELDLGEGVWPVPAFTTDKDVAALHALLLQAMQAARDRDGANRGHGEQQL